MLSVDFYKEKTILYEIYQLPVRNKLFFQKTNSLIACKNTSFQNIENDLTRRNC